ncbi:MAG: hypothetical protein HYZ08_00450 [Candidatus Kerfeldbacteria bacterium]|nr:hypothetical protein [Candidatus Kerfeldbacteria bacterium]
MQNGHPLKTQPPAQEPVAREPLQVQLDRWLSSIAADDHRTRVYAFGIIAGLLGVTLVLGVLQIFNTLNLPFVLDGSQVTGIDARKTAQIQTLDELRNQDTDQDTLDDYAELYVFETSPYTKDSDSDGVDDDAEVKSGNDPNCPEGETCSLDLTNPVSAEPLTEAGQLSASQIRDVLKANGVSIAQVDALTDEQVVELYAEVQKTGTTGSVGSSTPSSPEAQEALTQLLSLNASDLRNLLISSGVSEAEISKLTDEQVQAVFRTSLVDQFGEAAVQSAEKTATNS